jgi:5'-deoxynucleotidase YfbR-like HD superfamily hydrolase
MSVLRRVTLSRRAGRVTRYHGQYLTRPENIAEHTFGVLNILTIMTNGQLSQALLLNALYHDGGEYISGDMFSPIKRAVPGLREACNELEKQGTDETIGELPALTEWEYKILKVADNLDGLIKCTEEYRMGNYTIGETYGGYDGGVGGQYAKYLRTQLEGMGGGPISALIVEALQAWEFAYHGN